LHVTFYAGRAVYTKCQIALPSGKEYEHDGTGSSQALATAKRIILVVAISSALDGVSRLPVPSLSLLRSEKRVTGMFYTKPGS
jgi:hypothetical protein